tara:strand:- start:42751 stop:43383 length:633 start_codon:yes stop_codon:yes gene_type:complete
MENYETKLLSANPREWPSPKGSIPFGELAKLISINNNVDYENSLLKLAKHLPYKTTSWPSFGKYVDDRYKVEVGEFNRQLFYCERGSCDLREDCDHLIDLSYHILNIVSPRITSAASEIAKKLDYYEDQRFLIWLRMSSEIYQMYQVNKYFGARMLNANTIWMCEELVRMGVFSNALDAFNSEIHIKKGLMLSGMPGDFASDLYRELQNS